VRREVDAENLGADHRCRLPHFDGFVSHGRFSP
jgi:hypothetical protein